MKKLSLLLFFFLPGTITSLQAQRTEIKYYPKTAKAGEAALLISYGEYNNGISSRVYIVDVPGTGNYFLNTLANLQTGQQVKVYVDKLSVDKLVPHANGWQLASLKETPLVLLPGKHEIRFEGINAMVPMVDEIYLSSTSGKAGVPESVNTFLSKIEELQQQAVITSSSDNETANMAGKVLPNPEGNYGHAIDTSFAYSHYSNVYLSAGSHTFTTSGSTVNRSLTVFNPTNYAYSWSNINGGPGGESGLYLYVGLAGYYSVMLRPVSNGFTGTANIILDGSTLVSGAVIAGKTYSMSTAKGGPLNFFTCRITGGDTRMMVSNYYSSSVRGYNDDYYGGGGDFNWSLASRIKKDFATDLVQYGFVCAYSPTSTGVCDIYLGNKNSNVYAANYPEFPLLKADDVIEAAPSSGTYNCISWSGGVTSAWIWPPSEYSTYNCTSTAGDISCFDNFYYNNPVRYPGAWNFTRAFASVNNAVVDLWKLGTGFTHASVRKPGNNQPHGYDWESKPGGLTRTFHPRNALTNNSFGYGAVSNYYLATGTYARNAGAVNGIESDVDAVKAGLAIFDVAKLTGSADSKLRTLMNKVEPSFEHQFNERYEAWKKTWAANAMYSDPSMYCKNAEFEALANLSGKNSRHAMLLVFDKFVNNGDHFIGDLMWTLTKEKYSYLLKEVKTERAAKPNDDAGRYRIHGDHDNGVLYVEKILRLLEADTDVLVIADAIHVTVSPNPVKDRLTVQVTTDKMARVSVKAVSAQTRLTKVLQVETVLQAGTHRFTMDVQGFAGNTGDIIAVQVMVDGQLKTVKVLITK
jgi:hypothetical protein